MTIIGNPPQVGQSSFSGLASSALPSLGGESLARPTWKRSLQELAASNMALMNNNSNSSNTVAAANLAPPTAAAQILLGSRTDFGSLLANKTSKKTQLRSQASSSSINSTTTNNRFSFDAMSGGGIEAVVRKHRDGMLERILKDQREQTQRLLDTAVEKQVQDDWKEERNWWRKELVGDRNLVDATHQGIANSSSSSAYFNASTASSSSSTSISGGIKQRLLLGQGSSTTTGIRNNPTTKGLLAADYSNTSNHKNSLYATGCDPKAMQDHLAIVKEIQPTSDPLSVIAGFEQLANIETFGGGYKNAWMILSSMLPKLQSPIGAAQGAQSHFCKQYQTIINNHVKSASLSGQDISTPVQYGASSSMASTIASYVKLISGSNASVWEILYYCLRCGDANAASAVVNATPAGREEFSEQPILGAVIAQLSQRQGNASCMFQVGSPNIMARDRFNILDLYEKTKNLDPTNKHKLSVLALLCGQRLESFSTVEDYLFGCLWLALMDKENPIQQIEVIGNSIRKYGPSHFASDGSGEWGYVLPLIASQQFETALSYLAEAGGPTGLMQAAHLGIVFAIAGIKVADLGDASANSGGRDVVTALLVNYATQSEREPSARSLASLEYLLKIPNQEESIYQVANLIHRSPQDQLEILTGVLDAVGNRKNAFLDTRLPEKTVSRIIVTAAELLQKQASDRAKIELSAKLFMLGYSHSKLVQLLNEQLAPINVADADKMFWKEQSELFYNAYLSKRTNVLDSIEREGKLQLITTNRCLLELRSFYATFREGKLEEAFGMVARTGLIPLSTEDLNEKSSKFRDLDPILKNEFPTVLGATVECLCELFFRLKSESRGLSQVVLDRLRELEFYARYIFLFAGLVNMPSSCKTDIQRMRGNMIV